MRKNLKILTMSFMALFTITLTAASAFACTGVYVGKGVSADGSVMLMRTEDMESGESKRFIVHPAEDHEPGEYFTDAAGLKLEYPAHTYRYTAVPGSEERGIGKAPYGEAGFNELGVASTATITAYPNDKAIAADPFTENGLYELSINDIILSRAASAREGIEIIADIVDKYGSGEGSIIMTADKNEAWYMEIYTGHQYAAIRLPEDKAAVIANAYMLGEVDVDSEDVIASKDIISFAKQNNILKSSNGKINLRETYAEPAKDSNSIRIWGGRKLLHGTIGTDPYKTDYELLFTPSQKITVKEVMEVTRYRYEDTEYNVNQEKNKYIRAIGTARQEECHILQIRPNMNVESSCIEWLCMGNSEFTSFVPYYAAAITDTPVMCKLDAPKFNLYSMYWACRGLSTLCGQNRELYGNKVREFFNTYENNLINYVRYMDNSMAISQNRDQTANGFCNDLAYDTFNKSVMMYQQVMSYLAQYEGKAETENNTYEFSPEVSADVSRRGIHATVLPTVVAAE
ncbi:MAG: C69 family dipeptidase [Candidatus Ornithomonoglobus sp.]